MRVIRNFSAFLIIILCLGFTLTSYGAETGTEGPAMPDQATLSANRMRFDAETGDFIADGNVIITAGELKLTAPEGTGNVDRRVVDFDKGITASGKWYGDKINLSAGKVSLSFQEIPNCRFQGGVKGSMGTMKLDADRLTITGRGGIDTPSGSDTQTRFTISKARNIEDSSRGLSFGADNIEGLLKSGELHELTAKKGVWLKGKPKSQGDPVSLRGDNALYSLTRGSVVVSGHVTAIQGGRTLRSDSVVYFPEQNRVEALGGLTKRDETGAISADRAEITIDINRERSQKPQTVTTPSKPKEAPKTQPKKTTRTTRKSRKK